MYIFNKSILSRVHFKRKRNVTWHKCFTDVYPQLKCWFSDCKRHDIFLKVLLFFQQVGTWMDWLNFVIKLSYVNLWIDSESIHDSYVFDSIRERFDSVHNYIFSILLNNLILFRCVHRIKQCLPRKAFGLCISETLWWYLLSWASVNYEF